VYGLWRRRTRQALWLGFVTGEIKPIRVFDTAEAAMRFLFEATGLRHHSARTGKERLRAFMTR
jgi:hypothetical protein